jgi:HAD superfamily hydrolase (TIGR01549 family)
LTKAAIFDVDGTLVTFKFDVKGTRRAIIAEAMKRGFDTLELGLTTPTQRILESARAQVPARRSSLEFEALKASVYGILDDFEVESSRAASLFPGTLEVLGRLTAKGLTLAVLTNSGRRATDEMFRREGLDGYFAYVLTRDEVEAMKPRPEGLLKAVRLLGLPAGDVCYVGDSPYDIEAARLAGVKSVSVATGNYGAQQLRVEGADEVLDSMAALPDLLAL